MSKAGHGCSNRCVLWKASVVFWEMFSSLSSQGYFLKKRNPDTNLQSNWRIFCFSSSTLWDIVHVQILVKSWAFILIQVLWAGCFPKFRLLQCHRLLAASWVSAILRETFKCFHPVTVGTYYPGRSQKICYSHFIDQEQTMKHGERWCSHHIFQRQLLVRSLPL